ncbi:hypothetical protein BCR43DRAFT_490630 [Syncephalastrum racemosum]|uniref:EGF-like domain-containing protein n=1 Tax=Syncephalastrum racemosum TaxID=13706 RepID=A0A1X2HG90_SYNRA|nr:hypothetical protein BCR43DRAFT_490630 [Syncephalastrum racemosum]
MRTHLSLNTIVAGLLSIASVHARSTVYVLPPQNAVANPPTLSLDAFSVGHAQLTDTTADHPALHWEANYKQEAFQSAHVVWSNHRAKDCFERQTDMNLLMVVSGVSDPQDILPSYEPSYYVSSNRAKDYMAVAADTAASIEHQGGHAITELPHIEEDEFIANDVFNPEHHADKKFLHELQAAQDALETLDPDTTQMAAFHLHGLRSLKHEYGAESVQYQEAERLLSLFIQKTLIPKLESFEASDKRVAGTLIFAPGHDHQRNHHHSMSKRAVPEDGSCFLSKESCENGTSYCSERGSCVKSKDCFVCQCKSPSFTGDACQVIDATADFQLLFWSGVFLIVLTSGVLLFVYKSGNVEDSGVMAVPSSLPKQD